MLYYLDIQAMIVFTENSMNRKPEYFDEKDRNQFNIMKNAGLLYLSLTKKDITFVSSSKIMYSDREPLLIEIDIIASYIYKTLKKFNKDSISTYFGKKTPSKKIEGIENSFNFIIKCYDLINLLENKSSIYSFKSKIDELYNKIIEIKEDKHIITSDKKLNSFNKNILERKWFKEFEILKSMIKIKSIIYDFDINNFIQKIPLPRKKYNTNKNKDKNSGVMLIEKAD